MKRLHDDRLSNHLDQDSLEFRLDLNTIEALPGADLTEPRRVVTRTAGTRHGAITRLVSPGDLGQVIKPFVFLDDYAFPAEANTLFGMHPHSGIATLTLALKGKVWINDTVGTDALLQAGDVEWMRASGGAWHQSAGQDNESIAGLQLWLALPPHQESTSPDSAHVPAEAIPQIGPASLLLGRYQGVHGPVPYDEGVNTLHVQLDANETWTYVPPAGHSVAWVYVYRGQLKTGSEVIERQLAVFQNGEQAIRFTADEPVGFVLGSAVPHRHDLILGPYSVHTSRDALTRGFKEINRIGASLNSRQSGQ